MSLRCAFGLHRWVERSREPNSLWDTVSYRCSDCGRRDEGWEVVKSGEYSRDPIVRAKQVEKDRDAAKALRDD